MSEYRARLNADIKEETKQELTRLVPHGYLGRLFQTISEMLILELKKDPAHIMAIIFARQMSLEDILEGKMKETELCPRCKGSGVIERKQDGTL